MGNGTCSRGSGPYLGVVSRIEFFGDGGDVLSEELEPLLLKAGLVHVDIHRRDVLVASGQTLVLYTNTQEAVRAQDSPSSHTHTNGLPCVFLRTIHRGAPRSPPDDHTSSLRRLETSKHLDRAEGEIRPVLDYRRIKRSLSFSYL